MTNDFQEHLYVKRFTAVFSNCGKQPQILVFPTLEALAADGNRDDEVIYTAHRLPEHDIRPRINAIKAEKEAEKARAEHNKLTERQWLEKEFERLKLLLGK